MAEVAGVKFPKTVTVPGLKELELVGSGIREKRIAIINVKVYSVALYADHSSLSGPLAAFKGVQGNFQAQLFKKVACTLQSCPPLEIIALSSLIRS